QLIEMRPAEDPAERGNPRVVLTGPLATWIGDGPRGHGSELEDREDLTALPDARLAVKQRSAIGHEVAERDQWQGNGEGKAAQKGDGNVEQPLRPTIAAPVNLPDVEEHRRPLQLRDGQ